MVGLQQRGLPVLASRRADEDLLFFFHGSCLARSIRGGGGWRRVKESQRKKRESGRGISKQARKLASQEASEPLILEPAGNGLVLALHLMVVRGAEAETGHLSLPIRRTPGRRSYVCASVVAGPRCGKPPIHNPHATALDERRSCVSPNLSQSRQSRGRLTLEIGHISCGDHPFQFYFPFFCPSSMGRSLPCGSGPTWACSLPRLRTMSRPLPMLPPIELPPYLVSRKGFRAPTTCLSRRPIVNASPYCSPFRKQV
ncbi:hypothetical protein HDV57DRAFT_30741 [Trichoderma longibrachiatum]